MARFSYQRARRAFPANLQRLNQSRKNQASIPFFNEINCKHKLDRYVSYFRDVREPQLAKLCLSGSFFLPASMGTDRVTGIRRLGRADRKSGVACPKFSFFNKLHYRHEIDRYKYNFHCIWEPYQTRLGQSSSFPVPASTARISRAFPALKILELGCP